MGLEVTVDKQATRRFQADLMRELEREGGRLATEGERIARENAPVDTGELRDSIHGESARRFGVVEVTVGAEAEHAAYVEYGTENQAPQPFIQPAIDEISLRIEDSVQRAVREAERRSK